jgi:hypothetical protein
MVALHVTMKRQLLLLLHSDATAAAAAAAAAVCRNVSISISISISHLKPPAVCCVLLFPSSPPQW